MALESLLSLLQLDLSEASLELIKRLDSRTPRPISSIEPDGEQVQLQGRARGRRMISFPPTQQLVIGYRVRVELQSLDGNWLPILDDTRLNEFEVHDGSGHAVVHWLSPLLPADRQQEPLSYRDLVALGLELEDLSNIDRLRWYAMCIEHDSEVFVIGKPHMRVNPQGTPQGYREIPQQLVVRSTAGFPLLVASGNKENLLSSLTQRLFF